MAYDIGNGQALQRSQIPPYIPPVAPQYGPAATNPYTQLADATYRQYGNYLDQDTQIKHATGLFYMQTAGRPDVGSLIFPQGIGGGDFAALESAADAFAASAGWRYYPTSQQFSQMMAAGINGTDKTQVFQWLSRANGVSAKMPWAASGQTKEQWDAQHVELQATMAQYTGDPNTYSELISQAMSHGSGAGAWLQTQLTTNKSYTQNAKTPWLQYGLTAQEFKNQAAQHKQEIKNKYGGEATTAQQAEFIGVPPQPRAQAGSAVNIPSSQGPLVQPSGQSSIR